MILEAIILAVNNNANQFVVSKKNSKNVIMKFEYLDRGEGGVIRLLHTGISSNDLEMDEDPLRREHSRASCSNRSLVYCGARGTYH